MYVFVGGIDDTLAFGRQARRNTHYVLDIRQAAVEDCGDGHDNDGNGLIDWSDPACQSGD